MTRRRTRPGWLLVGLICASEATAQPAPDGTPETPARATQGPATDAPDPAETEEQASSTRTVMEATRRWARSSSQRLARTVDGWFGDKPFEEGGEVTDGRLNVGLFKRTDQKIDLDVRFRAHFRLPNAERYTYLFIGRDDRREAIEDTPDGFRQAQQLLQDRPAERSFLAGLGVLIQDSIDFRLGLGAGLKPFAQARYERPWTIAPSHLIEFRETVFWSNSEQFGSTTALSYDLALAPTVALRWLNAATITQRSRNFGWSSSLAAYKSLAGHRVLSLETFVSGSGTGGTGVGASDIGWLVRWEQPVYGTWLFADVVVGHFWPRPDAISERGRAWAAGASLKMRL